MLCHTYSQTVVMFDLSFQWTLRYTFWQRKCISCLCGSRNDDSEISATTHAKALCMGKWKVILWVRAGYCQSSLTTITAVSQHNACVFKVMHRFHWIGKRAMRSSMYHYDSDLATESRKYCYSHVVRSRNAYIRSSYKFTYQSTTKIV